MLSGEGNENDGKTNKRSNVKAKKEQLCPCSTFFCTFLCRCFARLQRETSRNFLVTRFVEEMSYVFQFTFFSLPLIFTLVASFISHFPTATTKFSCCSFNKVCLLCFYLSFWLSVALFLVELPWLVAQFLFFSAFFFLYIPNLWT